MTPTNTGHKGRIIQALKKCLKQHQITYKQVAEWLDVSEHSVKRLLASNRLSIERLEIICQHLQIDFFDLAKVMEQQQRLVQLDVEQERIIVSDPQLLLITFCVINGYQFQEILSFYSITEHECIQQLATLDRFKIITLLPNNKIKRLIAPNFSWIPNGPIQQFFQKKVQDEFFQSTFASEHEQLICNNAMLKSSDVEALFAKLQKVNDDFTALGQANFSSDKSTLRGTTLVLAYRQWQPSLFDAYRKIDA